MPKANQICQPDPGFCDTLSMENEVEHSKCCPHRLQRCSKTLSICIRWIIDERFLSQPFDVAKVFTGSDGVQVPLEDTIASFKAVVAGDYDHLPEAAFYMVGGIADVIAKAEKMAAEAA